MGELQSHKCFLQMQLPLLVLSQPPAQLTSDGSLQGREGGVGGVDVLEANEGPVSCGESNVPLGGSDGSGHDLVLKKRSSSVAGVEEEGPFQALEKTLSPRVYSLGALR